MGVSTTDKLFAIVRTLIDEVRLILADGAVWSFVGRWLGFWPCVRKKIQKSHGSTELRLPLGSFRQAPGRLHPAEPHWLAALLFQPQTIRLEAIAPTVICVSTRFEKFPCAASRSEKLPRSTMRP